jgi:hypothetical protein
MINFNLKNYNKINGIEFLWKYFKNNNCGRIKWNYFLKLIIKYFTNGKTNSTQQKGKNCSLYPLIILKNNNYTIKINSLYQ